MRSRDHEVYLQGSYKNDTNIRGDSDVDIVVQLNETFYRDLDDLSTDDRQRYEAAYGTGTYSIDQFDADVQTALRAYFGASAVTPNNKCVTVSGGNGRLSADVVCRVASHYGVFR
jgi:predicted nucleotidyltransferase